MSKKGTKMQTTGQKKETVYKVRIVEDDTYSRKNVKSHIITLIIGTGLFFTFNITFGLIEGKTALELCFSLGGEYISFVGLSYIFYFIGLAFNKEKL